MTKRMRALLARKDEHVKAARAVTELAEKDGRDITAEEQQTIDTHLAALETIRTDIDREQRLIDAERSAAAPAGTEIHVSENSERDPRRGFRTYGEFAVAVMRAGQPGGALDPRLAPMAATPTSYGNLASGQDGGFLVPPEFSREVFMHSLEEDALLPLTDNFPVQGNSMTFPRDETTPWGTDGIRAYWENEAAQATQTKPKGDVSTLRLSKLFALVPVTDELAADANALSAWIGRKTSESIRYKTNLAIYAGSGVGQPLGFNGHAAQVSVAKETSQTADTIVAANVANMYARMLNPGNAIWLVHHDAWPQLPLMTIGNQPIWTPPVEGFKSAPGGFLLGRPVFMSELCETAGDKGDIHFVNPRYIRSITKDGSGIETATSMHLFFDYGMTAFRAIFRIDAQPAISKAVAPANGSNSRSAFVTLDARA